jgi:ABC-type multidrug transport system fused ATPase/permease subunit
MSTDTSSSVGRQIARIARLVWAERRPYLLGSIFVAISIGTSLAYPYVIRLIIDDAIQGGQLDRLNQLSLMLFGILVVESLSTFGRDYFFGLGASLVGVRIRRLTFRTLLGQDIEFFDRRDTSAITTRLWSDVPPLEAILGEEFAENTRAFIFAVCGTGLLFYTSPSLTGLMLLAIPPIAAATSILGRRVKSLAGDLQTAHADAGAASGEVLAGVRTVRAFGQEPNEGARYDRVLDRALDVGRRKAQARATLGGLSLIGSECAALLAIWVGGRLIVAGRMTTGGLVSFILYALFVARGFRNSARFIGEVMRAVGGMQWLLDLLDETPRIPLEGGAMPDGFDGSIAFEHLRFRYPARPDVEALRGIDLRIAPGEVVALVGKSGSGKSTLLSLMLRFYDPTEGRVLFGGRDVRDLDPRWLRARVATVMQEPTLFSRSVAENIAYGADAAGVEHAARLARVDEFVAHLPGGYDSQVGDRGVQLSGGQRQRVAIARALLRRSPILILDEPTSALDVELESVVHEALQAIDYRPTTLIIAHRLSTVASVDRVVILDQGRIVASGTHQELLGSSAFYRQLVHTQLVPQ